MRFFTDNLTGDTWTQEGREEMLGGGEERGHGGGGGGGSRLE